MTGPTLVEGVPLALPLFAVTLFISAFLLFLVQPMIGKMILPRLGGTPQVWNTCMVFFQTALLAGYAYTHTVSTRLSLRRQMVIHGFLLALPIILLAVLFTLPGGDKYGPFNVEGFEPPAGSNPIPYTLMFLTLVVGLPFFVVSTSAPLLQRWFGFTGHPSAKDPYFLYGASNLGSMLSLLCYPFIVEPLFLLRTQSWIWLVGYILLVLFILACASMVWRAPPTVRFAGEEVDLPPPEYPVPPPVEQQATAVKAGPPRSTARGRKRGLKIPPQAAARPIAAPTVPSIPASQRPVTVWRRVRWVLLAAAPSSLMLGAITYMSTDLSPIPMLWVLPLALYLLTFILVFARYPVAWTGMPHTIMLWIHPLLVFLLCFVLARVIGISPLWKSTGITLLAFFVTAMVCHGELARDRPSTAHLTEFYLWMSFGGMLGGLFNGLLAPTLFTGVAEYPLALVVACLMRPVLRENGWSDGLLADALPGLVQGFRDTGRKLANLPALQFSLIVIVAGAVAAGCIYLINDVLGAPTWFGLLLCAVALAAAATVMALRFKPNNVLPFTMDAILGSFVFFLCAFLLYNGATNWHWLSSRPGDNPLLSLMKGLGLGRTREGIFFPAIPLASLFHFITIGVPLVFAIFFASRPLRFGVAIGGVLLANLLYGLGRDDDRLLYAGRSYFGVLRVLQSGEYVGDREMQTLHATPKELEQLPKVEEDGHIFYKAPYTYLMHGTTHHGLNFLAPKELRRLATTYYHRMGPTGIIMEKLNWFPGPQNTYWADARLTASFAALGAAGMGVTNLPAAQLVAAWSEPPYATVGLGTGTMASYGRPFQHVTFYEIDNTIRSFHLPPYAPGGPFFNYLDDAIKRGVNLEVIMGDARQSLGHPVLQPGHVLNPNRENYYRAIELDAFSSDAIPVHLITKEAITMYFEKLCEQGVLCVHTSNRHVDLVTPVVDIASNLKLAWRLGKDNGGGQQGGEREGLSGYRGHFGQEYVMLARQDKYLPPEEERVISKLTGQAYMTWSTPVPVGNPVWTDDYSNLAGVLRDEDTPLGVLKPVVWIFILLFFTIGVGVGAILLISKNYE